MVRRTRVVAAGATGTEYVRWVQSSLNRLLGARLVVNGVMGPASRNALRDFQRRERLWVDGIAGPETKRALIEARAGLAGATSAR